MKRPKKAAQEKLKAKSTQKMNSLRKKTLALKKNLKNKKSSLQKKTTAKIIKGTARAVNISVVPEQVYQPKFYTATQAVPQGVSYTSEDLPQRYDEDKIILQVRDPWWIYAYWEVRGTTLENLKNQHNGRFEGAQPVLRVYDVSFITFDGKNAHRYFDIEISLNVNNWYIDVEAAGRSWCIDIGFRLRDGIFILIARSNTVTTPLDGPSWITDEEWMIPDDRFAKLYGMGLGFGMSSPGRKGWIERLKMPIGSPGLFSITSPIRKRKEVKGPRKFWFVLDTELIVHGATEPDAKVAVRGQPIQLNSDGTFVLRFPLPDGQQTVPLEACSGDGIERRSITPIVSKETR